MISRDDYENGWFTNFSSLINDLNESFELDLYYDTNFVDYSKDEYIIIGTTNGIVDRIYPYVEGESFYDLTYSWYEKTYLTKKLELLK